MFGHHILTIVLITGSYIAHFTRIGTIIHFLMDMCDIFLPVSFCFLSHLNPPVAHRRRIADIQLAKMLRYLEFSTACDITFIIFLVAWLFTRQIGLAMVINTCYNDAPRFIPFKWDPSGGMYLTKATYYGFIGLITILLVLASVWFYMACSVAIRVIRGLGAEDSRSDDEGEEDDDSLNKVPEMAAPSVLDKPVENGVRKRK